MSTQRKQTQAAADAVLIFTEQEQLTVLLIGCRHAEAVITQAKGPAAERAALAFAREVLQALAPIYKAPRIPRTLDETLIDLRQAMSHLQHLGATWWGLPESVTPFDAWLAKATAPRTTRRAPEAQANHPLTGHTASPTGKAVNAAGRPWQRAKGPLSKARHAGRAPHKSRQPNDSRYREGDLS